MQTQPNLKHEPNDASPDNQTQDIQHTSKVLKRIIKRKFDTVSERLQIIENHKEWTLLSGTRYLVSGLTDKVNQLSELGTPDMQVSWEPVLKLHDKLKFQMFQ